MPASALTKNRRFRIGIVGFMSAIGTAIHIDTPTGKYILPAYKWTRLLTGQRSVFGWIFDPDCSLDGSCTICFTIERDMIRVEDQEQHEEYFIRFDDLRTITQGQMLPVYGTSSPAWKYHKSPIARMIQTLTQMTTPMEAV